MPQIVDWVYLMCHVHIFNVFTDLNDYLNTDMHVEYMNMAHQVNSFNVDIKIKIIIRKYMKLEGAILNEPTFSSEDVL